MRSLILVCAFIFGGLAEAKNYLLQMGGNCESSYQRKGDANIFLHPMGEVRQSLTLRNWETTTLYDSEPEVFKNKFEFRSPSNSQSVKESSTAHFFSELERIAQETEKSGNQNNQFLLWLDSHGSPGNICISENESIEYNDPRLQKILTRIQSHAKMGFVNEACFSGSAIKPLSKFGCVVAAQGSHFYSFDNPISATLTGDPMHVPSNLSELYLKSLAHLPAYTSPQISGFSEGQKITDQFLDQFAYSDGYANITRYRKEFACELPTDALSGVQRKNLQQVAQAMDQKILRENFGSDLMKESDLEDHFSKWMKEAEPLSQEFNRLSHLYRKAIEEYFSHDGMIKMKADWYHSKNSLEEREAFQSALTKVGIQRSMHSSSEDPSGKQTDQFAFGMTDNPNENWATKGKEFLSALTEGLKNKGIDPKSVINQKDPSYQLISESFAIQGPHLKEDEKLGAEWKQKMLALKENLKEVENKMPSYRNQLLPTSSPKTESYQFNQLLMYRYLKSTHGSKNHACDDFSL